MSLVRPTIKMPNESELEKGIHYYRWYIIFSCKNSTVTSDLQFQSQQLSSLDLAFMQKMFYRSREALMGQNLPILGQDQFLSLVAPTPPNDWDLA